MENMNLSDKSKEALKSEKWQELGEALREEIVKEYLKNGYADKEKQHDIEVSGTIYKVLDRGESTTFYDAFGNTLFSVENEKLAAEYEEMASGDNTGSADETQNGGGEPEEKNPGLDEPKEKSEGREEPAKCITGKSKSGICGAAAYCDKGLECCSACEDPCNGRCGWLDAQEESAVDESLVATEKQEEDFKDKACEKLRGELKRADNKQFADPVIGYLLKRCGEDNGLAQDVMQEHKTWEKCLRYIFDQARKQEKGNYVAVRGDLVYEWAEDYYHKDDKAEEEKKAKEAAERKKKEEERKKKAAEQKKADKKNQKQAAKKEEKAEEKSAELRKPKKNPKEIDGQMDLFSMMGM